MNLATPVQAVVLATHPDDASERGERGVRARRALAMRALDQAASVRGARLGPLGTDAREAPLPSRGWHWSISHTRRAAAAVVHRSPIGIDVEEIAERRMDVVRLALSPREEALFDGFSWLAYTRAWTAKEAVLKRAGVGLAELSQCALEAVVSAVEIVVWHRGAFHHVHQATAHDHVIAVAAGGAEDQGVRWIVEVAHEPAHD